MTIKFNRLQLSVTLAMVASLASFSANPPKAQATVSPKRPALVVGIVIDGLDVDRLHQLREYFGENGFNRLLANGVTITDLEYGSALDEAAATAVIYSGASPAVSGIPSSTVFDVSKRREVSVLNDPNIIGNFTNDTYSPASIRVSTLTDELRIDNGGLGNAHAVSPDAAQAIIMAGHAGNSAVWVDGETGKWASTTYYTELPTTVRNINHLNPLSLRMDSMSWSPTLPAGVYEYLPSYKKIYAFRHTFPRNNPERYEDFKTSALVNTEVTTVATDYIRSMKMGKGESVDMVNINYTLQPYNYGQESDSRAELMDTYLRLDRELARLFRYIDSDGPGMDRTFVFVAGTPEIGVQRRDDEKYRIPSGEFSPARAISLLKVYLMSIYGNGDWVTGYHDGQFFLNHDLIRDRGKDLDELRRESADFLRRMSGVNYSATVDEVVAETQRADSPFPPGRNVDVATAGDVFIAVAPGWSITDGGDPSSKSQRVVRATGSSSAAFILYPTLKPQTISMPTDARVLAPTVARLLRIRSPNGAQLAPLRL